MRLWIKYCKKNFCKLVRSSMENERIYIKNMVCPRCVSAVRDIFMKHGVDAVNVELGIVDVACPMDAGQADGIRKDLEANGFELIDDRRMRCVEQIRIGVIEYVRDPGLQGKMNMSDYLQRKCHREYSALSKLFTEVKGMTVERFGILQKVEMVKEYLFYGEMTVSEIADMLHYSSVAHLSSQFKSVTGMSPTEFRQMKDRRLSPIDGI